MKIFCWLTFLPCAAVLIAIAQLLAGLIVANSPWWLGLPLVFFSGVIVVMAGLAPVKMTSDPKVAATVLLTLFVLFETLALTKVFADHSAKELIGRILVDIQIIIGALMGTTPDGKKSEKSAGAARF
ncbi:MAG: hypothetical protein NTW21_37080 [Verrucomicrobia bacterium]|nr:hypothetical protein [Verrucomicrobiota bacterium]